MLPLHGVVRFIKSCINMAHHNVVRKHTMAHSQNGFDPLPP